MTTPPIQTLTDELLGEIEAAANDVRGWTMREYFQEPEEGFLPADWEWYVGSIDEDGNRYPLLNVNAHQYDSEDSEKLAKYYALANRDDVLAMAAELRTLRVQVKALQSDANSWQSGYDEGRRMAGKHRLSEIEQLRAENAELRKDAGRYRALRNSLSGTAGCSNTQMPRMSDPMSQALTYTPTGLDRAIDTAMEQAK